MSTASLALYHPIRETAPRYSDRVSVVMVTFNKYEYIRELIKSFVHLNYDASLLEIVVVDNNSQDGTEEKLREEFKNITVIQTGANLGGSGGFNTGMRYVMKNHSNEYIWLLDNDVVVHPDSLNWLLDVIKHNPNAAAVGSMILQLDNPDYVSEIGAFMDWTGAKVAMQHAGAKYSDLSDHECREVEYCAAASLLKTRSSLNILGYWQDLFIHYDDVDWCLRAKSRGMKILCQPKSIVFHESMDKKQPTWIKYYNIRNLLYLYANFNPVLLPLVFFKFTFWSIYLTLHSYYKNAGLAAKAIIDFILRKKAKQDFPVEQYQAYEKYDWSKIDPSSTLVFYNAANFLHFIESSPLKLSGNNTLVLYKYDFSDAQTIAAKFPNLKVRKPKFTRHKNKIIFDGAVENHLMLPSFSPKLVVYPLYKTLLDL